MTYNNRDSFHMGKPIHYVLDADGKRYEKDLIECDNVTGRIVRRVRDSHGSVVLGEDGRPKTEELMAPAPLSVLFRV